MKNGQAKYDSPGWWWSLYPSVHCLASSVVANALRRRAARGHTWASL